METTQLQIHFEGRSKPILLVTTEEDFRRLNDIFEEDVGNSDFIELSTLADQSVWLNKKRIQYVNFLSEFNFTPRLDFLNIKKSEFYGNEDDSRYDTRWDIDLFFAFSDKPYQTTEISASDWVNIFTSFDDDKRFVVVRDEDDEDLAIRIDQIDILIGTEIGRYSPEQREGIEQLIKC